MGGGVKNDEKLCDLWMTPLNNNKKQDKSKLY